MNRIKIFNGDIITPIRIVKNGCVIIENEKISGVYDKDIDAGECLEINAEGNYISPGFVDIHTHGGGGHDFMDGTIEAYLGAAEKHAQYGTTSMVPTTVASTNDELKSTFDVYKQAKQLNKNGAEFLGLHLEGPYFSMEQRGAQDPRYIRNPIPSEYEEILTWSDDIIRWSAAPELDGALEFGRTLKDKGILVSLAHTNAIYEEVVEALKNGYTHVTHLYSGTSGVRRINAYRYAGVIESALLMDELTVEIIADGCHLPESLLKLIYKVKGASRIALITDSMRAAGTNVSESIMGSLNEGRIAIIEDGVAKLPDRTSFAGSIATTDRLVRTMVNHAGVSLIDAVKMASSTPAEIIGVGNRKGKLAPGSDGDVIIFDNEINIIATIIKGKIVYKK